MDYTAYSAMRHRQLVEGGFAIWVYRHDSISCEGRHEDLDGLALPPEHEFWQRFYPPIMSDCGCYVVGARNANGVRRVGGDPVKQVPDWVVQQLAAPASPRKLSMWEQIGERISKL